LQRYFSEENIQLEGNIVFGLAAEKLAVLISDVSLPLSALITTVLKDSNNVYAESLTKTLGRQLYHQGTFLAGSRAIKHILAERAAIDFKTAVLVDGSGQSRYDLVSPLQIVRLLLVIAHDPELAELFKNALPESGTDGTLSTRLNSPELIHHIHAKTGSFKGVATLSGYITTKTGTQLTFSILLNQVVGGSAKSHALQAKIAAVLYNAF
jgi:serine-type D-Ala-D-Ala carboxypeptidase/endopeptidase (penicillin-binding protein 4)